MRRFFSLSFLSAILFISALDIQTQQIQTPLVINLDTPVLSLDKVKLGLRGYGLTVFKGTKPELFYFTVLGVSQSNKYYPVILAKQRYRFPGRLFLSLFLAMPILLKPVVLPAISWGQSYLTDLMVK